MTRKYPKTHWTSNFYVREGVNGTGTTWLVLRDYEEGGIAQKGVYWSYESEEEAQEVAHHLNSPWGRVADARDELWEAIVSALKGRK